MKHGMKSSAILLVAGLLLTGCATSGSVNSCAGFKPIYLDEATLHGMTERDAADILAHNETGAALCGWGE